MAESWVTERFLTGGSCTSLVTVPWSPTSWTVLFQTVGTHSRLGRHPYRRGEGGERTTWLHTWGISGSLSVWGTVIFMWIPGRISTIWGHRNGSHRNGGLVESPWNFENNGQIWTHGWNMVEQSSPGLSIRCPHLCPQCCSCGHTARPPGGCTGLRRGAQKAAGKSDRILLAPGCTQVFLARAQFWMCISLQNRHTWTINELYAWCYTIR